MKNPIQNAITDIPGIEVGQTENLEALTGCTVVLCRQGTVAGVDVRGGAPGTRETDLLNPLNLVEKVHAVVLAGGSAFGLDAANGVMRYLEEHGIGFETGAGKVPIVPAAILFDLSLGRADIRPVAPWATRPPPRPAQRARAKATPARGPGPAWAKFWACAPL
jgi:L-aminopeptidase/D-esterase-like protein